MEVGPGHPLSLVEAMGVRTSEIRGDLDELAARLAGDLAGTSKQPCSDSPTACLATDHAFEHLGDGALMMQP